MFQAIMSLLHQYPGISEAAIQRHLPAVAPADLTRCLELLRFDGKLRSKSMPIEPVSLFSQPTGARSKKRKRRPDDAPALELQQYLFPTRHAFAL